MEKLSFKQVVQAVRELTPAERAALARLLEMEETTPFTREQGLAEMEALRATGAFDHVESLRGKYARPDIDISDEELHSFLRDSGRQWEEDFDFE